MYFIIIKIYKNYIYKVLKRLLNKQLCYKLEKCEFYKKKVTFLGFLINKKDIKMDFSKIEKILD